MGKRPQQPAGGTPRAEGVAALLAPVRTAQMDFEPMARPAEDGGGGYAPHVHILLVVRPEELSTRREDVLCRCAFSNMVHDPDAALEALGDALRLAPRHFKALFNRAATRLQADAAHSFDPGLRRDLDLALEISGRDAHVLYNRAVASQMRGDYAGAIEDLDEAIARSPRSSIVEVPRTLHRPSPTPAPPRGAPGGSRLCSSARHCAVPSG